MYGNLGITTSSEFQKGVFIYTIYVYIKSILKAELRSRLSNKLILKMCFIKKNKKYPSIRRDLIYDISNH